MRLRPSALAALAALTALLVLLAAAQLLLPGLAARSVRDRLGADGLVAQVTVRAFPAIELLWHHADTVSVRLDAYRSSTREAAVLLGQVGETGRLDLTARTVQVGLLRVRDARLSAREGALSAAGRVSEADLRAAVPFLGSVVPVLAAQGALVLRGTAGALGFAVSAEAAVTARDGALVVVPAIPLLPSVTVFSDRRIAIETVTGAPAPGGFNIAVTGRLR